MTHSHSLEEGFIRFLTALLSFAFVSLGVVLVFIAGAIVVATVGDPTQGIYGETTGINEDLIVFAGLQAALAAAGTYFSVVTALGAARRTQGSTGQGRAVATGLLSLVLAFAWGWAALYWVGTTGAFS